MFAAARSLLHFSRNGVLFGITLPKIEQEIGLTISPPLQWKPIGSILEC
jgi:hypothetical protein